YHTPPTLLPSFPTRRSSDLVMGIEEPAPAVVTINTVVAGLGATAGLNLFVSLTGKPQPVDELYDATSGTVFPVERVQEPGCDVRSEEHTSELQSRENLGCRL